MRHQANYLNPILNNNSLLNQQFINQKLNIPLVSNPNQLKVSSNEQHHVSSKQQKSEGSHQETDEQKRYANNKELTLVIGLFFDGTGNNGMNLDKTINCKYELDDTKLATLKAQAINNQRGLHEQTIRSSSYTNYYTNVWLLYELYQDDFTNGLLSNPDTTQLQTKIYIEGIGTQTGKADGRFSLGTGRGETGIIAKVETAIVKLVHVLKSVVEGNPERVITHLKFDLIGFSRGAAAARHFVNLVQDSEQLGKDNPLGRAITGVLSLACYPDLQSKPQGSVRFLGLLDTVAAIASPANLYNPHGPDNPGISLQLPASCAEGVFQISAQHECRYNFSLNSIKPDYHEMVLPGTHTDIGGGYHPVEVEQILLANPLWENIQWESTPLDSTRIYRKMEQELKNLRNHPLVGPLLPERELYDGMKTGQEKRAEESSELEWIKISTGKISHSFNKNKGIQYEAFATLSMQRQVLNDWSKVVMRVMLEAAQEYGAIFNAIDEQLDKYHIPADLLPYKEKVLAQGRALRAGKPVIALYSAEVASIAKKYVHCSANWDTVKIRSDKSVNVLKSVDLFYINRPNTNWFRAIYPLADNNYYG